MIKKDCDGQFFIDYFTGALSEFDPPEVDNAVTYISWLRSIIVENLNKENVDERVLAKYIWMRNKFNESYIHICSNETIEQLIEGEHMNPEDLKGLKLIECK